MENEKIYVCYGSSDEYAEYTGISLLSLLYNNPSIFKHVFIMDYGISEDNKLRFAEVTNKFERGITFIDAETILSKLANNLGLKSFRGSYATYSRAFVDYLVPSYVDKLLYVDSDTIIDGSLAELKGVEMREVVLAAVIGVNQYKRSRRKQVGCKEVTSLLSGNSTYYAMGVVLYSLENWRKMNCRKMIEEACYKGTDFQYAEQSLINAAIPERFMRPIHPKYNYWGHLFNPRWEKKELGRGGWFSLETINEASMQPAVIHYKGLFFQRPWYDRNTSRLSDRYRYYKSLSPWRANPLKSFDAQYELMSAVEKLDVKYNMLKARMPSYFVVRIAYLARFVIRKLLKAIK